MKNILILGKNGQVGYELQHTLTPLGSVTALDRSSADLSQQDSLVRTIRNLKPDIIVNAAAYTAVDKAESEQDLAMLINGKAPGILADEAKRLNAILIHYSTDYVFDGQSKTPYCENDTPKPLNIYGKTKLLGEQAIQASGCKHIILRTSWVYGTRGRNFLLTMLRLAKERSELKIVNDQFGAPTWSRNIAQKTAEIIMHILKDSSEEVKWGIYNLTASGQTSWHGFAKSIFEYYQFKNPSFQSPKLVEISSKEYPLPAQRPMYSLLSHQKLLHTFSLNMLDWELALKLCIKEII